MGPLILTFLPAPGAHSLPFSLFSLKLRNFFSLNLQSAFLLPVTLSTISPHTTITMASTRVFASRLASQMATKAARPAVRAPVAAASKRTISGKLTMRQKIFLELN